jgi:hypothetical protein
VSVVEKLILEDQGGSLDGGWEFCCGCWWTTKD